MSKTDDLANWYLRLNGFLTIPNFILHPSRPGSQRTEADVIGVRFPFRREFEGQDFDDAKLQCSLNKPSIFLVEVKTRVHKLNEAWKNSNKANINKVLADLGFFESDDCIASVAQNLYNFGRSDNKSFYCSLLFIGNVDAARVPTEYSSVPRILWEEIIAFIHKRFRTYFGIKAQHEQWDEVGQKLYQFAVDHEDLARFEEKVRNYCLLPAARVAVAPEPVRPSFRR